MTDITSYEYFSEGSRKPSNKVTCPAIATDERAAVFYLRLNTKNEGTTQR